MALNLNKPKIARTMLAFAAICGTLGALDFFKPASLGLSVVQSKVSTKAVSGDIVVVGIDSSSIKEVGRWPWPRDTQAELLKKIDGYGPKAVYLDIGYQGKTTARADASLKQAIETMKAPISVIALASEKDDGTTQTVFSDPAAVGSAHRVSAAVSYYFGYVWELPSTVYTEKGPLLSIAASATPVKALDRKPFRIDYSFDPSSIPTYSAKDVFSGTLKGKRLLGKTVMIGMTDMTQNDVHSMPGWGQRPGIKFQALGAETLKSGKPIDWGWPPLFLIALLFSAVMLSQSGLKYSRTVTWLGNFGIIAASTWLTVTSIGNNPLPSVAFLTITGYYIGRQKSALIRSIRYEDTGFSNMTSYMVDEVVSNALFIAASLHRPETKRGYILEADSMKIMKEAGRRLSTIIDERQLTHNEDQQFLWEMPQLATSNLSNHLEGLRQLFAEPLIVDGRPIDVDIFFGVDRDINTNIKQRTLSALHAADIARQTDATFKIATTISFDDHFISQFKLEFDAAISNGDITTVFEAQQDLSDVQVRSAEASLSWTHPSYGRIANGKLFALAKSSGHLATVTHFLCEQAIENAAQFGKLCPGFGMSVKVSIEIVMNPDFGRAMRNAVEKAQCSASDITFDIIGLHDLKHNQMAKAAVNELQKLGFRIGIGGFGITSSDIDLLKIFTPDEIFLAETFSAELLGSTSNQIFADGALRIASAKNIVSTAEGINDRDVLKELSRRGCDRGKGKIIARAMNFNDFSRTYLLMSPKMVG
jgi:diguanylate cyclase